MELSKPVGIAELMARQEALDDRKRRLMEVFIPFRDALVARLEQFTHKAVDAGLARTRILTRESDSPELLEATFTLDGLNWRLIAPDAALGLSDKGESLFMKILIYPDGEDTLEPHIEIVVAENKNDGYRLSATWRGEARMNSLRLGRQQVTTGSGRVSAEALLRHFYSFQAIWPETLPLGWMKSGSTARVHPLGFRLPRCDNGGDSGP